MYVLLGNPKTIDELRIKSLLKPAVRKSVQILVIDDKEFPFLEILRTHNYSISKRDDLSNVRDVAEYDIILCDIRGVGKALGSRFEGAHLIKEIRTHYPQKAIIAYTAESLMAEYNDYLAHADFTLQKDIDLEQWIDSLDRAISLAADPASAWRRTRLHLLADNIPIHLVMRLEDEFVKHAENKQSVFPSTRLSSNLPSRVLPILKTVLDTLALGIKLAKAS